MTRRPAELALVLSLVARSFGAVSLVARSFGAVSLVVLSFGAVSFGTLSFAAVAQAQGEVEGALQRLESERAEQRVSAAELLGRRGGALRERVVPALRRHLRRDDDWHVRASAGRALGRLAARDAVPDLVAALRDPVVDVRVVAAAALWRLPDPAAVPALLVLLGDPDASVRQWGVLALGVIGDRRATRPIIARLEDDEAAIRLDAVRSLGRLGDPVASAALEAVARSGDRDEGERLEAVDAISNLDGPEKRDALVRLLRADDADVRARAAQALGRVGDALSIPPLRERRRAERTPTVRRAIDAAVEAIQARGRGETPSGDGHPLNLPPLE